VGDIEMYVVVCQEKVLLSSVLVDNACYLLMSLVSQLSLSAAASTSDVSVFTYCCVNVAICHNYYYYYQGFCHSMPVGRVAFAIATWLSVCLSVCVSVMSCAVCLSH